MKKFKILFLTTILALCFMFIGGAKAEEFQNITISDNGTITWDTVPNAEYYAYGIQELNIYSGISISTSGNLMYYLGLGEAVPGSLYTVVISAYSDEGNTLIGEAKEIIRYDGEKVYDVFPEGIEPLFSIVFDYNGGTKYGKGQLTYNTVGLGYELNATKLLEDVTIPEGKTLDAVLVNGARTELGSGIMIDQNYTIKYLWKDLIQTDLSDFFVYGLVNKTYNGKAQTLNIRVSDGEKDLVLNQDYKVTYRNNVNAGTADVIIDGIGSYKGGIMKPFKINKANNPLAVTTKLKTVKYTKVKKKKQVVAPITVAKKQGTVTFIKQKGSSTKLTISKTTGKITVKKGTKKGTYKIKVKITANGNKNYKAKSIIKTIKVRVK